MQIVLFLGQNSTRAVVSCNPDFLGQSYKAELLGEQRVVFHS